MCPYEQNGCKFRHELSKVCNLGIDCKSHMCPFRHELVRENSENKQETVDDMKVMNTEISRQKEAQRGSCQN